MTLAEVIAEIHRLHAEWDGHADRNRLEAEHTESPADEEKAAYSDGMASGLAEAVRLLALLPPSSP